jgi:hypothetical protein
MTDGSAQSPVIYNRYITERATLRLVTRVLGLPTMAIVNGQGVHFSGVKKCARPLIDINQAVQISSLTVEGTFVVHAKRACPARLQQ